MDSTSKVLEKSVGKKNGLQEAYNVDFEDNQKHLESSIESDSERPGIPDHADLIIKDSEPEECSSDDKVVAETPNSIKPNEVNKPSLPAGLLGDESTDNFRQSQDNESKDLSLIQTNLKSDNPLNVSEANTKVDTIFDSTSTSASNSEKAFVPQDALISSNNGGEVKITEEMLLRDCIETVTKKDPTGPATMITELDGKNTEAETVSPFERDPKEPTTLTSELDNENIESETVLPIEPDPKEPTTLTSELDNENIESETVLPIEPVNKIKELCKNATENKDAKLYQEANEAEENNYKFEHVNTTILNDFNNHILDIISDIDINIKAQEKITQLKEQELQLIQKQNELLNQINQQQLLAQQLSEHNQLKQSQRLSDLPESQNHHQNSSDFLASTHYQKNSSRKEPKIESKTVDLRKIFTPATDTAEILPKHRKLYASSAFYSPTLHPTVEDQVELARRISHSLSDISNQTSKGQSMYVNRKNRSDKWVHEGRSQDFQQYQQKPAISPNILPAYSDAGKHRVQLNIHQNQLIEKYSRPGLQVVQSPWEAALQTGSASSAFLEDIHNQSFSSAAISPVPYNQRSNNDFKDAVEPSHYISQNDNANAIVSSQQSNNVPSNPQRDLAYTPCVAQGWGGRNVHLPKGLYVPKEISLSSYTAPPQQCAGHKQFFESPSSALLRSFPKVNFPSNTNLVEKNCMSDFPKSKPLAAGFGNVALKQQLHSPPGYKQISTGSENVAPQVNFSPSPLSSDKLARYENPDEINLTRASPRNLNARQKSHVDNASPIPFGIALKNQTTGSLSSTGSAGTSNSQLLPAGSPRCVTTSPTSSLSNQGQTFNKCARGWGVVPDNQQTYQSQYPLPFVENLPFSDF